MRSLQWARSHRAGTLSVHRSGPAVSASDVIADFFTAQPTRIRVEHSDSAPLCYIAFGSRYRKLPFDIDDAIRLRDALHVFVTNVEASAVAGEAHVVEQGRHV